MADKDGLKLDEKKEEDDELYYLCESMDPRSRLVFRGRTWVPSMFLPDRKKAAEIERFQCRDDDVLVSTFPKSGTTWLQEIVYQIVSRNVIEGRSSEEKLDLKFPFLEFMHPGLDAIQKKSSPRLVKTHLSYGLIPEGFRRGTGKIVYIARNVKDVCVSNYEFVRMHMFYQYKGDFANFFKEFISGKVHYGPWMEHVLEFWQHRKDKNILFVTYEDLQEKPEQMISEIAEFLGYPVTAEESVKIARSTSFNSMKDDPLLNYKWLDDLGIFNQNISPFMRKGKVGDWKNYFTPEMEQEIEEKCIAPLKSINLNFKDT